MFRPGFRHLLLASAALAATPALAVDQTLQTEEATIRVETVADGLSHP